MQLTEDYLRSHLAYDSCTGLLYWINDRAGGKVKAGDLASRLAKSAKGYRRVYLDGKYYKAHHIVWCMTKGYWPTKLLDHINGNRADNREENLRELDEVQNAANRGTNKNNKLHLRGVHEHKPGVFRAAITFKGVRHDLGLFTCPITASAAYEAKSKELRGEYHRDECKTD